MKSKLLKPLTKYIILLIINYFIFIPWNYFFIITEHKSFESLIKFQTFSDYGVRIIITILLAIDFNKLKLKYALLACISSLFYPLLGIIVFSLLFLEKEKQACA